MAIFNTLLTNSRTNSPTAGVANTTSADNMLDTAAMGSNLKAALKANLGYGYDQQFADKIGGLIDSGADVGSIRNQLDAWGQRTTSSKNAAAKSQVLGSFADVQKAQSLSAQPDVFTGNDAQNRVAPAVKTYNRFDIAKRNAIGANQGNPPPKPLLQGAAAMLGTKGLI
jgi:hypothetical protein